ncbi:unnamed protein product [marine sediment metagenome]|uniref:Dihydroorotase catalytic domain-containing protein n=1 Tax=marine sediment metagenome TaxID=412755 RepID=X1SZW9_9ZZZZ
MSNILIKGGRVIDPKTKVDDILDILITGNKISKISKRIKKSDVQLIDAKGKIVCPGFIDLHCHLRDPGRPDEETIESGGESAIAGGFTTICCMPNTEPAIDNEGIVKYIYKEAARANLFIYFFHGWEINVIGFAFIYISSIVCNLCEIRNFIARQHT